MSFWVVPQNWYWSVQDSSPSTMVWKSSVGALVAFADSDYVAFLAAGNVATTIDTMANLLIVIDTFNQSLVRTGYVSIAISGGNYTFTSALNALIPKTINVSSIDMTGRAIIFPQENLCGSIAIGDSTLVTNNDGSNSVDVLLNDGSTKIATVPSLGAAFIIPTGNGNTNGTWEVFYLPSVPLIPPLTVSQGGTGQVTLTAHSVLLGEGTAQIGHVTPGGGGTLLIGQAGTDPSFNAMSGDATITNAGVVTVAKLNGQAFAPTSFAPTDQSGAGLTFSSVNCQYCQIGNMVFYYGTFTYPSPIVSGANSLISLPVPVPNQPYALVAGLNASTANGIQEIRTIPNSSTAQFTNAAGVVAINSALAGLKMNIMLIYPAT